MKITLLILVLLLAGCASTQTDKQKEDMKKMSIIRAGSCVVIPTLPFCIVPGSTN